MPHKDYDCIIKISIPAPARGATITSEKMSAPSAFQFPPLREGRHTTSINIRRHAYISIPAPARGATRGGRAGVEAQGISIPAPARGATSDSFGRPSGNYFNSRPCERGDSTLIRHMPLISISIPAPARGATLMISASSISSEFQFPPLREGRPHEGEKALFAVLFQFPPLREGRLISSAI